MQMRETAKTMSAWRDDFVGTFASAFEGVAQGTKKVGDAFADMFGRIAAQLAQSGLEKLGGVLFDGIFGGLFGGGGDPLTSALAGPAAPVAVMHTGGVAGIEGGRRNVPMSAFFGAQRHHGGGWPGLRPNEVPAILERGERVLSRRDAAGGGQSAVRIDLGPGLIAEVLDRARGQSVEVVQRATPGIVGAAIRQSVALNDESRIYT